MYRARALQPPRVDHGRRAPDHENVLSTRPAVAAPEAAHVESAQLHVVL
jgi:hypothetical protein